MKTDPRSTVTLAVYYLDTTGQEVETVKSAENVTGTISRSFNISSSQELTTRGFVQAIAFKEGSMPGFEDARTADRNAATQPFRVSTVCPQE